AGADVACPAALHGISSPAAIATTTAPAEARRRSRIVILLFARLLDEMAVEKLFGELHAVVFLEVGVLFYPAVKRHPHFPWPREHLRILDVDFVIDHVRRDGRIAFDDVERIAVEVARAVEPGLVIEVRDVDDQRVAFPAPRRPSHPRVARALFLAGHLDRSRRV